MHTRRIAYVLVLAASVALSVMYLERRQLLERYEQLQEREAGIAAGREQILGIEQALENERAESEGLETNPLEVEAAIRRIKRGIRDGEIVYHVEGRPAEAPAPAVPSPEEDTP
ncbi:MAG: hypothetical protein GC168_17380 [Candidatus Hydrogenedens sp.]|nr:hypothetical protein [Candidatus Hydrogenedens sp.]